MAYGNFGRNEKLVGGKIAADHTINQFINASENYRFVVASAIDVIQFLSAPNNAEFNITVPTAAGGPGTTMTIRITSADTTGANAHSTASSPNQTIGIGGSGIVPLNAANAQTIAGQIIAAINDGTDGANITIGSTLTSGISGIIASAGSGTDGKITLVARAEGAVGNSILLQNVASTEIVKPDDRRLEGGRDISQIPFSLGLSGVVPFNIGSTVSKSAYIVTKGKTFNND